MDLLDELECMANNANISDLADEVSAEDISRWQRLFGYSAAKAQSAITTHRIDLARPRVGDSLWETVASTVQAKGHNRESYEYSVTLTRKLDSLPKPNIARGTFIIKLEGPLDTAEKLQKIARLPKAPSIYEGHGEESADARFCEIDGVTRYRILCHFKQNPTQFRPTIVRLAKAAKRLCSASIAPTLGRNATMPQNRPEDKVIIVPLQDEHPVWYFFYGSLRGRGVLAGQISIERDRKLIPARIRGGRLRMWAGKYRALVDDFDGRSSVAGEAFLIESKEEEDALRFFETDNYEVVRCQITTDSGKVMNGLTFRFVGNRQELTPMYNT